ncbi:triphosphoribosyl-dephospho-CoA synthase [Streptomyces sp. NBC_01335]|uniref:triphosphoribosyl-dephospho-CoA synthase n=1 Tax=Streptomyces sp. NBC_01335 TaxID=2903828 RepID=UPI002E131E77|nr:triphosphoribosyl-dephospho-CoA synthase [Streptomyces sp. NBC_01335]
MATLTTTPVCAPPRSGAALAAAAVGALLSEAALTPKPGLVDLRGKGAHADMDVALMTASALALRDTFTRLAATGAAGHHDARLRADLARIGRDGEVAMMRATGGVNTHRGAIWALGLTVAAVAALPHADTAAVLRKAAGVAAHPDPAAPPVRTKGAAARATYRVAGAVGAARAGFPGAARALRVLRRCRASGEDETSARLNALLACMTTLDDTCLLARGGPRALRLAQDGAAEVLRLGGAGTPAGAAALTSLDAGLLRLGLSPGGSADMLALALLLDATHSDDPDATRC